MLNLKSMCREHTDALYKQQIRWNISQIIYASVRQAAPSVVKSEVLTLVSATTSPAHSHKNRAKARFLNPKRLPNKKLNNSTKQNTDNTI